MNNGARTAVRWLQAELGVVADGVVGKETMAALAGHHGRGLAVLAGLHARRMAHDEALDTWAIYGRGWQARILTVLAHAVALEVGGHRMSGTGTAASDAAGQPAWLGWLGAAGQAAAGAAKGAVLGRVVSGVGTAVGAAAGGILGLAQGLAGSPVPLEAKPALPATAATATGVPASAGKDAQVEALTADPGGAMTQFAAAAREVAEQERTKRVVAGVQASLDARRADLADVADARDHPDAGKAWLAAAVFVLFAAVLGGLEFHAVPAGNERVVDAATGGLFTAFVTVVGYYFGSSAGSAYKTRLLARPRADDGDGDGTAATRR